MNGVAVGTGVIVLVVVGSGVIATFDIIGVDEVGLDVAAIYGLGDEVIVAVGQTQDGVLAGRTTRRPSIPPVEALKSKSSADILFETK